MMTVVLTYLKIQLFIYIYIYIYIGRLIFIAVLFFILLQVNLKFILEQSTKAQSGIRSIALLFY